MPGAIDPHERTLRGDSRAALLDERFAAALLSLAPSLSDDSQNLLVAVSGGADSLALLVLAEATLPGRVRAASVDHGLRPESGGEAAMVAEMCAARGVPHVVLRPDTPIVGSVQAAARRARYALLKREADASGCAFIATAHHADDQLETLLMRLARGSGLDGMAAIRAVNGRIVRPLLGFRKAELEQLCRDAGLDTVDDPSNRNPDFDRARMRQALRNFDAIDPCDAARTAAALASEGEAMDWLVARELTRCTEMRGDALMFDPGDYPPALLRRLVRTCLRQFEPVLEPRGVALDALIDTLRAGQQAMLGETLCKGGTRWSFRAAPPRNHGNAQA